MAADKRPIVWSIAGSDSGGGAGIQADLATFSNLGCHGCSVITTLTAQSSVAVTLTEAVSEEMLLAQLNALLGDLPPKAIKIGLLANQAQLQLLCDWLARHLPDVPLVVDPVMVASCGDALSKSTATGAARLDYRPLAAFSTVLTPNIHELALLSHSDIHDFPSWQDAATCLANELPCHLLAKGGDFEAGIARGLAEDLLLFKDLPHSSGLHQRQGFVLASPRQASSNNHGSGCTLSSAIAAFLAHDWILPDALILAKAYINGALAQSYRVGTGPGPLGRPGACLAAGFMPVIWPLEDYPWANPAQVLDAPWLAAPTSADAVSAKGVGVKGVSAEGFKTLPHNLGIYPVVADVELLEALLKAGCRTIQLRLKQEVLPGSSAEQAIIRAIALGRQYQARVFINDHWQQAIAHGAFGVHLGQEDLSQASLEAIQGAGLALGLSSHGYFEALLALRHRPSYLALGHIFATKTKVMPSLPQGLARLGAYSETFGSLLPTVAIGGIDEHNLDAIKHTGVANVAVVRAITEAAEPVTTFRRLTQSWLGRAAPIASGISYAQQNTGVQGSAGLSDRDFIRYGSQLLLPRVSEAGQLALRAKTVAIVGLGGLGHHLAHSLAAAGVGRLILIDPDIVELGNLPRQLLYNEQDIGRLKVDVAKEKLGRDYPNCLIEIEPKLFGPKSAELIREASLVLDASDNFLCRHNLNQACVKLGKELIAAAISADSGLLCHTAPWLNPEAGCYECLFPRDSTGSGRCRDMGVLGPAVQTLAAMQSLAAINTLLRERCTLGRLISLDCRTLSVREAALCADPACLCCQTHTQAGHKTQAQFTKGRSELSREENCDAN
ncbi:bifunctional hydroxymethylpyrimidine kinase/phosphomethylpyrimidine kinase [Shewanella algae]|uniref:bifunctional hydroxymethylpyrimidine kinase/phosphomethylpyrimidine kinase n=1 Tax=Shewanella algae TaxID=38313 RepID=UPI002231AAAB|nr:bifunctional hydroxymethylpyrimidine kinase/phosphomethylpyrimidine kinase [Shewanella algae]UZD60536.1 bifunctional hydroxymethylpyrimidine kinase/phosphomethylpyrimidine kinase [Shewanella algae]